MKPTVGRIVLYNHPGSADGTHPPCQSPAIVQSVIEHDGETYVNLWVFGPHGFHKNDGTLQGDGPCQWNWPQRV